MSAPDEDDPREDGPHKDGPDKEGPDKGPEADPKADAPSGQPSDQPPVADGDDDDAQTRIAPLPIPASDPGQPGDDDDDLTLFSPPPASGGAEGTQAPETPDSSLAPLPAPRTASVQNADEAPASTAIPVGIGTLINNNYEIREVLKSGGMGEVYRGIEIGTGDPVAIKAILPELAEDEKAGLLFKREARTLRQLADEAIVRYYNYVHDRALDRYFLVMEFIEGVPLSDHMKSQGKLPVPAVFTLLKRLSKGLSKAHEQDVIHRDLSPDNVMLSNGDVSQARLIDFGIAKSNVVTEGTMHGQFAGKLKYVAPEQLGHYGGKIEPATDIYGLGLLSAAAAIGEPLNMGGSIVEAVQSRQSVPDLSAVPEALRPILSHMLEPEPGRRPASMEEVRRMLENPALIPAQYRAGLPPPPALEATARGTLAPVSAPPVTPPPPGLQMPMMAGGTTTRPPVAAKTVPPAPAREETDGGGGKALGLLMLAFAVVCAGVGFVAWQSGMLGGRAEQPEAPPDEQIATTTGIPAPQSSTRAGFLSAFDSGACTYLGRVPAGPNAGMIEGYSRTGSDFPGLPVAYEEKFGARPAILPRAVTAEQCPALDFARALQGRGREAPQLQMSTDRITSGEAIRARIDGTAAQGVWAALITPAGGVFNLTGRLSDPVGGQRSLSFGLNLNQGAEAVPQLVLIVESDRPLVHTANAADGSSAADLLPLVLDEIAGRGGAASASLGYVMLEPPAAEPEEEQTGTDDTEQPEDDTSAGE